MKTINKSKLSGDLLSAYDKIQKLKEKDSAKGLEMEQKFISILDKKNHESIVSKPIKKSTTKKVNKNKTAKKTTGVAKRRTVMTVAKEIRKKDESWQDALKRAKLDMNKSTKKQVSAIDDELSKLKNLIKNDKNLKGFKGSDSDLIRDASRKALPKGKRISKKGGKNQHGTSKGGRVYYENRENRSDRYAPKYPKDKPYLKYGGDVMSLGIANADAVYSKGGKTQGQTLAENFNLKDEVKNVEFWKNDVIVEGKNGKVARIDLDKGERIELNAKGGDVMSLGISNADAVYSEGGAIKGSNRRTGESYGVVIGSREVMDDGSVFMNVRTKYDSRISESKLKFNNGNIEQVMDYGYTLDGSLPSKGRGSGKNYYGTNKAETIKVLSKLYNPSFAKKLVDYSKQSMAKGGSIEVNKNEKIIPIEEVRTNENLRKQFREGLLLALFEDGKRKAIGFIKTPKELIDGRHLGNVKAKMLKNGKIKIQFGKDYYAEGGEIDLFEDYQSQPKELSEIVEKYEERYADGDMDYKDTERFLKEVNAIGYTFDNGLDNEPYNLRPMMAKGGDVMSLGISNADAVFKKGGELYTPEEAMEFANKISKKLMAKGGLTDYKYIPSYEIYEVVTKDGKVYENDDSAIEFLSGAYVSDKVVTKPEDKDGSQMTLFDKGGKIPKGAIYIKRRDIDFITVGEDEDDKEKVSGKNLFNGFWIDPIKQKILIAEATKDGRLGKSKAKVGDKVKLIKGAGSETVFRNFPNGEYEVKKVKKGNKVVPEGFYEIENKDGNKSQLATSRFAIPMAKGGETETPFDDEVIVRNFFDGDRKKYEEYQKEEERRKNEPLPFADGGAIDSLKKDMNSKLDIHSDYYAKGGEIDVRDEGNMAKTYDGRIGKISKVDGLYYTLKFKDGKLPSKLTLHQKDIIFF